MPLYTVTDTTSGDSRLVEAARPSTALAHVVTPRFTVATADAAQAHKLALAGVAIETAGAEKGEGEAA